MSIFEPNYYLIRSSPRTYKDKVQPKDISDSLGDISGPATHMNMNSTRRTWRHKICLPESKSRDPTSPLRSSLELGLSHAFPHQESGRFIITATLHTIRSTTASATSSTATVHIVPSTKASLNPLLQLSQQQYKWLSSVLSTLVDFFFSLSVCFTHTWTVGRC